MEMDFGSQIAVAESVGVDDEAQMRSAVDGLDDMEAMLREGEGGEKLPAHPSNDIGDDPPPDTIMRRNARPRREP